MTLLMQNLKNQARIEKSAIKYRNIYIEFPVKIQTCLIECSFSTMLIQSRKCMNYRVRLTFQEHFRIQETVILTVSLQKAVTVYCTLTREEFQSF